ncbi:Angiopoietin-related protein 7 [Lamellibrachia satsuma]|nr:Angiopoietin-related protein 7 [Lamellibrachia satsuma]
MYSRPDVVALHENVVQLRNQIAQLAREISTMKNCSGKSAKYVYLGCPEEMIQPTFVQLMGINISQVTDIGERILLEPLMPHFPVFCAVDKYIVIQRRSAPYVASFNRSWEEYKNGFGDVRGEFWLGLEKIHQITRQPFVRFSVRVEAKLATGLSYYAEYNNFYIGDESQNYRILSIGAATAKSNNYFLTNGTFFATADRDHKYLCGARYNGFWYFENSSAGNVGCGQMTLIVVKPA